MPCSWDGMHMHGRRVFRPGVSICQDWTVALPDTASWLGSYLRFSRSFPRLRVIIRLSTGN